MSRAKPLLTCDAVAPAAAPDATVLAAVPPTVTELAIEPEVAVIAPVIVALVAVNAPAGVTLNGADAGVALPKEIPLVLSALNISLLEPIEMVPPVIVPPDSVPVNVPLAEDNAPLKVPEPFITSVFVEPPVQTNLSFRLKLPELSSQKSVSELPCDGEPDPLY